MFEDIENNDSSNVRTQEKNKSPNRKGKNFFRPSALKEENELPDNIDLTKNAYESSNSFSDDTPLLEELGVRPDLIQKKMLALLKVYNFDKTLFEEHDMTGSLLVFFVFGFSLFLVSF